ncbi:PE family protein [Mycobacterium asiaticum]|uniref:PE domain-containing protein n=1 Tax=Mycobacterium asiaticum TaxID=1790 RepID=A0A1A3N3I2_MYCAS|nr:PE family protein [Mycobacterium asiaticum]OBK16698.1 hypothetical protein A5636_25050 [Mycobacterium asiaticum]
MALFDDDMSAGVAAVVAVPELIAAAATDLATIDRTLAVARMTAAGPTSNVLPAAADEVSGAVAQLFSQQAREYQRTAGHGAAYLQQFVEHLALAARSYGGVDAANASTLGTAAADAYLTAAASALGTAAADASALGIANASALGTAAAGLPSFDPLVANVTTLFFQVAAGAYYLLFPILLPPIFLALAIWLPLAFLSSVLPL